MLNSQLSSVATAPGKVILFGEHAVVYGTTAVAASLSDMRIKVETKTATNVKGLEVTFEDILDTEKGCPSIVSISFEDICNVVKSHEDPHKVLFPDADTTAMLAQLFPLEKSEVRSGMMSVVYIVGKLFTSLIWSDQSKADEQTVGLVMNVKSQGLPIGAGLGSSASFSVAVVASCLRLQAMMFPNSEKNASIITTCVESESSGCVCLPNAAALEVINGWAFASEILLHGCPSGLDNTTSCYGGLVKFSRKGGEKFENITGVPALHILLVNTRVPRSTKQLVAGVRTLHDAYPEIVDPMLESMNSIALNFLVLVEELKGAELVQDSAEYAALVKRTGELMAMNHHLLNAVGVGHPALTAVVDAAAACKYHLRTSPEDEEGVATGEEVIEERGFACKLTGAGGGGCAIVLSPVSYSPETSVLGSEPDTSVPVTALNVLVEKIRSLGCDVFHSSIAGDGVVWVL